MAYLYETHLHTCQASACANSLGHEYVKCYRDRGYAGIFITDHFVRGNCAVDPHLPWTEFVRAFAKGYEDARNEGEKIGFPVFFGWEETFDGDDFLVYGLTPEWLLEHPEARRWSRRDQYDAVRAQGGCVVQAHPFRERAYIHTVHLSPYLCDAVEVVNCGNTPQQDALALRFAAKRGLAVTAGSDIHAAGQVETGPVSGVALAEPLRGAQDYARALRGEIACTLLTPPGRQVEGEPAAPQLPVDLRDRNDRSIPVVGPLY